MCAELKNYVAFCKICNKNDYHQGKEPLKSHTFPSRPWSKVSMDIFRVTSNNYLILIDYYSSYFEINSLENLQANTVVNKVRNHFARYGIPDIVLSDCGSQFLAKEFQQLAKQWCFKHVKSPPYHHQSNGKAENAVNLFVSIGCTCTSNVFLLKSTGRHTGTSNDISSSKVSLYTFLVI